MTFKQAAVRTSQTLLGLILSLALVAFVGIFVKAVWKLFMFGFNLL